MNEACKRFIIQKYMSFIKCTHLKTRETVFISMLHIACGSTEITQLRVSNTFTLKMLTECVFKSQQKLQDKATVP